MNSCISSRVCCLQVSFHASPTCRGTHCSGSQAARPRNPGSPRVALVTSRREDPVQVVRDGPQVDDSWTHAGVYLGLTDISCRCTCSICTACFVVWRPRRATDTSTNRRQDFLCRRTASMEHAADTAEDTAVDYHRLSFRGRAWGT